MAKEETHDHIDDGCCGKVMKKLKQIVYKESEEMLREFQKSGETAKIIVALATEIVKEDAPCCCETEKLPVREQGKTPVTSPVHRKRAAELVVSKKTYADVVRDSCK